MEIDLLTSLTRHENIISMREWFEDDENFIIIFDRPKTHKDLFGKLNDQLNQLFLNLIFCRLYIGTWNIERIFCLEIF